LEQACLFVSQVVDCIGSIYQARQVDGLQVRRVAIVWSILAACLLVISFAPRVQWSYGRVCVLSRTVTIQSAGIHLPSIL